MTPVVTRHVGGPAECVVNISEGRDADVIADVAPGGGDVERIDLTAHRGAHPRLGAVDVVPFVPLADSAGVATPWEAVLMARHAYARWSADDLGVPCFLYGTCLLYTSPSPRDGLLSRMPSSA